MIKWCLGIWDEAYTLYYSYDVDTDTYFASPLLEHAVVYDKTKNTKLPFGVIWLPIFVPDPQ